MIKPLPGYVLIEPIEDGDKSGEIYLPETSKDKPSKGRVISTGLAILHESGQFMASPVDTGNICYYKKWTNQEVEYEGKKYLLVAFSELLGVIV